MSTGPQYDGAHKLDGPITVIDAWQSLHSNAKEWESVPKNSNFFKIREMLDQTDRETVRKLRDFDEALWGHLCFGAGWTAIGVMGLSWCKGGSLERVAEQWKSVCPTLSPDPMTFRTASMLNPQLLPDSNALSEIVKDLDGDAFKIALIIAAKRDVIEQDMSAEDVARAPDVLKPILDSLQVAEAS